MFISGKTFSETGLALNGHQSTYGGQGDAFLAKYNSNGSLQWSTYYGGSEQDESYGCTTDNLGNIFICGETRSSNNIAFNGFQNTPSTPSFLVKFNTNGERIWGTYYGQAFATDYNVGYSCATDSYNNVYLAGRTNGTSNIASQGLQNSYGGGTSDAYLVKFDPSGARLWGTYYGGSNNDGIRGIHVDAADQVYVAGTTQSPNNIFFQGFQNSQEYETGFVAKIGCLNTITSVFPIIEKAVEDLSIYPNPNNGQFILDFGNQIPTHFSISNAVGKIVFQNTKVQTIEYLNLKDFTPGIYYVRYYRHGIEGVKKIIIQD